MWCQVTTAAVSFNEITAIVCLLPLLLLLQAGMARFPNDPRMLVLYANYIIHVRKQPRAARQQLQLAAKYEPSNIDRYSIFCAMVGLTLLRFSFIYMRNLTTSAHPVVMQ
jgi:hypothetical protein